MSNSRDAVRALQRIVIFASKSLISESKFADLLADVAHCQQESWESVCAEKLLHSKAHLIVLHLESATEPARRVLRCLQRDRTDTPVLAILPECPDNESLQLVSDFTEDFLFAPLRPEEFKLRAARLLRSPAPSRQFAEDALRADLGITQLVGEHPAFIHAVHEARLFAASDAPVLITGETGTGKELFAHAIHSLGRRRNGPFIPLDCGTLPEHLAENELFGHRRGAYTDAHADQKGLAAMAHGGTLFLDEIDALSATSQSRILRFLQEGTYRVLGSEQVARSDVRIIGATNRPIEEAVRDRQFRNDLYFRINVLRLTLPPLRERRSDIAVLARHFLGNEFGDIRKPKTLSLSALQRLEAHSWPGNVRELHNTVQRALLRCHGREILPEHISLANGPAGEDNKPPMTVNFRSAKQLAIEQFEQSYIESLLFRFQGNITRAAREAGKERRAFGRLVKKYGIG